MDKLQKDLSSVILWEYHSNDVYNVCALKNLCGAILDNRIIIIFGKIGQILDVNIMGVVSAPGVCCEHITAM